MVAPTTKETATNVTLLLQRIAQRDPEALSELYDLQSVALYSVIVRVLRRESDAEGVLQEVFLRVWETAHLFNPGIHPPSVWLVRIARNLAVDRLRSNMSGAPAMVENITVLDDATDAGGTSSSDNVSICSEHRGEIMDALGELPRDQRELIEFAYYRGYTQSELSQHFTLPLGTVKSRVRSAMSFLRTRLHHLM